MATNRLCHATATKTRKCRAPAVHGWLCDEHGGYDVHQLAPYRLETVEEIADDADAALYFWLADRPEAAPCNVAWCSTFKTNFTPLFCEKHHLAHEGAVCPLCECEAAGEAWRNEERTAADVADAPDDCAPPVLGKTDDQKRAAGWTREAPSPEVYEQWNEKQSKRGRTMAKMKAKANGETSGNGAADPIKVINCTKTIRVKLTDAECRQRGELAGAKQAERNALEEELDAHKKEQKGKIDALDAEIGTLLGQVYNGHESRPVACRKEYLYRTNTVRVVRVDTGEELESRAMLPEELEQHAQVPIQADGANEETAKPEAEDKPKRGRKKRGEAAAEQSAGPAE